MSFEKNGAHLKGAVNKAIAFGAALLLLTTSIGSLAAAYDPCCPDPCYQDPCCFDPCACDMPDFVVFADFIYWQVHPEGLQFARRGGFADFFDGEIPGAQPQGVTKRGCIISPDCELEPGFRLGLIVDLGCCNWDFYAQYTYLCENFDTKVKDQFVPVSNGNGNGNENGLFPLIWNPIFEGQEQIGFAKGEWDSHLNVLDFGLGRTFSVNCCFDFRPHFGFKATWQDLCFDVIYAVQNTSTERVKNKTHFETEFDGIGLRGGFDAAWRFSPCISLVGGFAFSSVWSNLCTHREDRFVVEGGLTEQNVKLVDIKEDRCALIPVTELLFGLRYDTTVCDCYDVFLFLGWENQVWWNLNNFLFVSFSGGSNDSYQFGPHGNITYQGLTVRAGLGF